MSKYSSKKSSADGITFDSTVERDRYIYLKLLEKAGEIVRLEVQPVFILIPKQDGERAIEYIADFRYWEGDTVVVEDIKSVVTVKLPAYVMKRKMMLFFNEIKIRQIIRRKNKWFEL